MTEILTLGKKRTLIRRRQINEAAKTRWKFESSGRSDLAALRFRSILPTLSANGKTRVICGMSGGVVSIFFEVKVVAADAEVFNNVGNNAARHVARMPGKGDEPVRPKWIGIMPVTAGGAEKLTTNLAQAALQLPAIP